MEFLSVGDHASRVASRIVFGETDAAIPGYAAGVGDCRFLDVIVPAFEEDDGELSLDDKAISLPQRTKTPAQTSKRLTSLCDWNNTISCYAPAAASKAPSFQSGSAEAALAKPRKATKRRP